MRDSQNDPWTMYYVIRKDRALSLGQAMSLAGAGAVQSAQQWRAAPAWAQAFASWHEHSYRKVALRADGVEFGRLRDELDGVLLDGPAGETLLVVIDERQALVVAGVALRDVGEDEAPVGAEDLHHRAQRLEVTA